MSGKAFVIGGVAVVVAAAILMISQRSRPDRPIVNVDKPLPNELRVLGEDSNSLQLQWTGDFDIEAIRDAMEAIYEQKRLDMSNGLNKRGPHSEEKLFLMLWVARTTKFSPAIGPAHFTANSGRLSHVIPPWSEAEFKEAFPFDADTRPSAKEEEVYLDFRERLSQLEATFKFDPDEDINAAVDRDSKKRADLRARFCESRGISLAEFDRIEAHNVLWSMGAKATAEAIHDYLTSDAQ